MSPAGDRSWAILEAEPDDGRSVVVIDPALRTRAAADTATNAFAAALTRRATTARLRIPGRPGLRPGGNVDVQAGGSTTTHRFVTARHTLDATGGYLCELAHMTIEAPGNGVRRTGEP